jgi:N-acetylglucosamine kinase-like BadF-type ATPase
MGDEGSGHDLARRALSAAAGSVDGRLPHTTLVGRVCDRFGVATVEDLLPVIYDSSRTTRLEYADLSKAIEEEARKGDAVARMLLADAGRELAKIVIAVVRRLGLEDRAFPVAYVGGVFNAGELVLEPLRAAVRRVAPGAEFGPPLFDPAVGAAKLAVAGPRPPAGDHVRNDREALAPAPGGR